MPPLVLGRRQDVPDEEEVEQIIAPGTYKSPTSAHQQSDDGILPDLDPNIVKHLPTCLGICVLLSSVTILWAMGVFSIAQREAQPQAVVPVKSANAQASAAPLAKAAAAAPLSPTAGSEGPAAPGAPWPGAEALGAAAPAAAAEGEPGAEPGGEAEAEGQDEDGGDDGDANGDEQDGDANDGDADQQGVAGDGEEDDGDGAPGDGDAAGPEAQEPQPDAGDGAGDGIGADQQQGAGAADAAGLPAANAAPTVSAATPGAVAQPAVPAPAMAAVAGGPPGAVSGGGPAAAAVPATAGAKPALPAPAPATAAGGVADGAGPVAAGASTAAAPAAAGAVAQPVPAAPAPAVAPSTAEAGAARVACNSSTPVANCSCEGRPIGPGFMGDFAHEAPSPVAATAAASSLWNFTAFQYGREVALSRFQAKVTLVVPVASGAAAGPAFYRAAPALLSSHWAAGLRLLAVPCSINNQAPHSSQCERNFLYTKLGAPPDSFPVLDKTDVMGPQAAPFYKFLEARRPAARQRGAAAAAGATSAAACFEKFLVDVAGQVVERYAPDVDLAEIEPEIMRLLR